MVRNVSLEEFAGYSCSNHCPAFLLSFPESDEAALRQAARSRLDGKVQLLEQNPLHEYEVVVEVGSPSQIRNYSKNSKGGDFHTDGTFYYANPPDFVAVLCVSRAATGGESILVPVQHLAHVLSGNYVTSYNILIEVALPFAFVLPNGDKAVFFRRVLRRQHTGIYQCEYYRMLIEEGYARLRQPIPPDIAQALNDFDSVLYSREVAWRHALTPGEMLCFDNSMYLHGRTEFVDKGFERRKLIRYWGRWLRAAS